LHPPKHSISYGYGYGILSIAVDKNLPDECDYIITKLVFAIA